MRSLLLLPLLLLSSCAAMEEQYRAQTCHREVGYEKGTNDAQEGKPMDSSFASGCDPTSRREVMQGYREGYEQASNVLSADEDGIRVKVPGIDIRMGSRDSKSWSCEVKPFGKGFRGLGASRAQASADARKLCEEEHHAMHCDKVACKQER